VSEIDRRTDVSTFRLRRRTPGSFLLVPFPKQKRSIRCQGQLEGAAAVILASCPLVADIREQPVSIWYQWRSDGRGLQIKLLDGQPTRRPKNTETSGTSYIVPDFLVHMVDGRKRLVEVKPSEQLDRPVVKRKLAVGRLFASQQAWTFHVITEQKLYGGPLLSNLRLLGRYRHMVVDNQQIQRLEHEAPAAGIKFGELRRHDGKADGNIRLLILHLLATGRLSVDPRHRSIDDQTLIFPGGTILWDPFASEWARSGCSTGGPGAWSANSPPSDSLRKTSSSS
jgi:hypothetical protein